MMNQANWCLDACCHRASLGSILLHYDLDPVLILGPSLFTSAVLDSGYLRFGKNFLSNMVNLCARRGLAVEMRPARPSDSWEWARNYLRQGVPLAAVVDAYYLPYFYRDYRVFHHPHMIIVSSYDPATDVLHVIDADNTTRFSGSLSRKQFMDALESRWPLLLQRSQYLGTWVRVEPFSSYETPSRLKLVREVYQAARNLMHDSEELSPASIAHFMLQQIDDYLAISAATPHKRTFETWKHGSSFHRGLRFTSHALRWLAKSIQRVSISFGTSELRSFSTEIAEMADGWMTLRALYIHHGLSPSLRRSSLGKEITSLATALKAQGTSCSQHLQQCAGKLLGESSEWRVDNEGSQPAVL